MPRLSLAAATPLLVGATLIAGCGSSSSSSSSGSSAPAAANTAASSAAAAPASTPAAAPAATTGAAIVIATKHTKMGTVLAGTKGKTLYLFQADKPGASACTGTCASVWPPVVGTASVSGQAVSADLGTITRSDGTKQVTYKGHPLYYFAKDQDSGDAYGQGIKSFGAEWYVLAPSGHKVDNS